MITRMSIPVFAGNEAESLPAAGDTVKIIVGEAACTIRIDEVVNVGRLSNDVVILDVLVEIEACQDDPSLNK